MERLKHLVLFHKISSCEMSIDLVSEDKAAKAAEEYAEQLHEIYKHECYGTKKKECKFILLLL